MKVFLVLILSGCWINISANKVTNKIEYTDISQTILEIRSFKAIAYTESRFKPNVVNAKENAVGILQIRLTMLNEVNRLCGYNKYTGYCRLDISKSVEMFLLVQRYYKTSSTKEMCMLWNTGCKYPKNGIGSIYWGKIKEVL